MPLANAVPKPTPRWVDKAKKRAEESRVMKDAFRAVSSRDGYCCRVCRRAVGAIGLLEAGHHHHLQYRSTGGRHDTDNLVLLCVRCHQAVHDAEIRLSGDANLRSPEGTLCGVVLERYSEGGWRKERVL